MLPQYTAELHLNLQQTSRLVFFIHYRGGPAVDPLNGSLVTLTELEIKPPTFRLVVSTILQSSANQVASLESIEL